MNDEDAMRRAIHLARTACGWTNPNPLVGAVIVKDGRVIGEGCHRRYGEAHAERAALAACSEDPRGATMYVTLEPCCHKGKQPPCSDALIEAGIARVAIGSSDPNPLVCGKGVQQLRKAGVRVDTGVMRAECDCLNTVFFHFITTNRPYVVAKWAMTLDGKTATTARDARWVSNEASRADVHELRHRLSGVMTGIGTVLADDPLLTCRRPGESRQPARIVCDSHLRIPERCKLVQSAHEAPLLVAAVPAPDDPQRQAKAERLRAQGAHVLDVAANAQGRVDLPSLMEALGKQGIDSLLLEGGSELNAAAFAAGIVNKAVVYLAPKVAGGRNAPTPVSGAGVSRMADALRLNEPTVKRCGDDLKLTYVASAKEAR